MSLPSSQDKRTLLGSKAFKEKLLKKLGWKVVSINWQEMVHEPREVVERKLLGALEHQGGWENRQEREEIEKKVDTREKGGVW